ncbi:MAG: AtpZ/AtpI family protein [Methylovirgula sp.]|uniref:AtpZ/AtpI family protein n=1 Tax=Methylovirgula sp. TaxID=1978224 RepID=UPI003076021F
MTQGEDSDGRREIGHINEGRKAEEDAALQARLSKLSNALAEHRNPDESETMTTPVLSGQSLGAANLGLRVLVEFISAISVGALIGWQIDAWVHTAPIFLIAFLFLGLAAGMLNIYRTALGPKKPGR